MKRVIIAFWIIGIMLLTGMIHYIVAYLRPGIFPPKKILKARAKTLGGASFFFWLMAILMMLL